MYRAFVFSIWGKYLRKKYKNLLAISAVTRRHRAHQSMVLFWAGWPDWANFRPLVDSFLWAVFSNITDVHYRHLFGRLFSFEKSYALINYMTKKWVGCAFLQTHPVTLGLSDTSILLSSWQAESFSIRSPLCGQAGKFISSLAWGVGVNSRSLEQKNKFFSSWVLGDRIGRIFAHWAIVYFGQFF
jgi:hypothetical protein